MSRNIQPGLGLTCYKTHSGGPFTVPGCAGAPDLPVNYCAVVPDGYLNFITS